MTNSVFLHRLKRGDPPGRPGASMTQCREVHLGSAAPMPRAALRRLVLPEGAGEITHTKAIAQG